MTRFYIAKQLEKSAAPHSIVKTDASNEQMYLPTGAAGTVLTSVAGVPTWQTPAGTSISITDGVTTQVLDAGNTLTVQSGNGVVATVSATDILNVAVKLSANAGNDITFGTDGGIYLSKDSLLTNVTWNDATNNLVLTFDNGSTVNVPIADTLSNFLADFTISDGTTTDVVNNHETVLFVGDSLVKSTVSGNQVKYEIDNAGSVAGQVVTTNGTVDSWGWALPRLQRDTFANLVSGTTVTLTQTPAPGTYAYLEVFRNGMLQVITSDYTIAGTVVTFINPFGVSGGASGSEVVEAVYYY
jgi:hypothetical protein